MLLPGSTGEMGDSPNEDAVAGDHVERFGVHELVRSKNKSTYKDVQFVQRKKRPWQAKVWDESRGSHICLGSFATPRDAAVAVAVARAGGIENLPSPDKSRAARGSVGAPTFRAALPSDLSCRS